MNMFIRKYLLFVFVFTFSALGWADNTVQTPLAYLTSMTKAYKQSTYELLYILKQGTNSESFRFRHAFMNDKEYAQLLNLDHNREEIILKNQKVSYLGNNFRPFSLNSPHILDNLPSVLYTDFNKLKGYSFLDAGRDRVADRVARVIRIIPNDILHYAYTLWIDEESRLLLKSQVKDVDNIVLEEFSVLQLYQSKELEMIANAIDSLMLPALTSIEKSQLESLNDWHPNWIPAGFQLIENQTTSGENYQFESEYVDSRLYSDGLSTFTIYAMPSQGVNFDEYAWQQGKLTILNQTLNDKDIVIIGDIPLKSAQQIMKHIHFTEAAQK
ncbi:sigma E regulator RseB [Mannheimia varigena]|nr:sigma E regulator RseB [Mannheimia varigena]